MILITVIVGTFLGRLDQTVVNLAIPKIIEDFGATVSSASWIVTAYIIANAVFVPIWGKLGDTIGRKKIYIFGFVGFIIGSILAGLAWNLGSMVVFRIFQAVASSADYPTAMAIIAITFREPKERAQALGIWSSAFASSAVPWNCILITRSRSASKRTKRVYKKFECCRYRYRCDFKIVKNQKHVPDFHLR